MKVCSKCKESKGLEEFNKDKNHKDGLRSQCKSCIKEYREKNPYQVQSNYLSNSVRQRAKKRKLPIDLDFISSSNIVDWLKHQPNCVCCDRVFGIGYKGKFRFQNNSPSLDRLIPSLGYISGNVFLICFRCNALKRDATVKELETVISWMKKTENYLDGFN